jgi:hypothetical protein
VSARGCDMQRFPKGLREEVVKHTSWMSSTLVARSARWCALAGLALATAGAGACGSSTVREGTGSSYLIINALEGASGAEDSPIFSPSLGSDVRTGGGWVEDLGRVRMTIAMKDVTNPNSPTTNNSITVNRYRVSFRRSDGRNTQGVDVPYAFDGAVTFTVHPDEVIIAPFVLVRVQSKLEAPLMALTGLGGAVAISTLADVTFYGRDQTGREASVTGTISVNFADWADPS